MAQIQVYLVKQLIDIGQTKSAQELQGQLVDLNDVSISIMPIITLLLTFYYL